MTNTSIQIGNVTDWFIPSLEELKLASSFINDSRLEILYLKQYGSIDIEGFGAQQWLAIWRHMRWRTSTFTNIHAITGFLGFQYVPSGSRFTVDVRFMPS